MDGDDVAHDVSQRKAYTDFFEAFRNFSDRADERAIECLICVVIAAILRDGPTIDPFNESNSKSFEDNPKIQCIPFCFYFYFYFIFYFYFFFLFDFF